jgi:hypothetical protein
MLTYACIRAGRWLAVLLGIFALASMASAQLTAPGSSVPLRGPPLNTRAGAQQITVTNPVTGNSITFGAIPQHQTLMPGPPIINPLNNYSIYDYSPSTTGTTLYPGPVPVFAYPPEMQGPIPAGAGGFGGGIGGGIAGGIGGGIAGGIGGGIAGGIGGIGGGIGGIGGGIGGIGGGIGGIGGGIGGIGGGIGGFGGGIGGALGALGARTFTGGQGIGFSGFGGTFSGFGGALGATGGF